MKVRVKQLPAAFDYWVVESKEWWHIDWTPIESFIGDGAFEKAKKYAEMLKHPNYVEIK